MNQEQIREGYQVSVGYSFMSNELNTPIVLICPKDRSKKPAASFESLTTSSVTYRLRSGTNVADTNPREVLMVCPIDGNTLYCDGTVEEPTLKAGTASTNLANASTNGSDATEMPLRARK